MFVARAAYLRRRGTGEIALTSGDPFFQPVSFRAYRDLSRVLTERQADTDLERLRREMWRRLRLFLMWNFGFPLIFVGVAALLVATDLVHLQ